MLSVLFRPGHRSGKIWILRPYFPQLEKVLLLTGMPQDVLNCCKLGLDCSSHLPLLSSEYLQCCCSSEWKFLELLEGDSSVDNCKAHSCFPPCFPQCRLVRTKGVMPQACLDFGCSSVALRSSKCCCQLA